MGVFGLNAEASFRAHRGCIIALPLACGCERRYSLIRPKWVLIVSPLSGIRPWTTVMASKRGGRGNPVGLENSLSGSIHEYFLYRIY